MAFSLSENGITYNKLFKSVLIMSDSMCSDYLDYLDEEI